MRDEELTAEESFAIIEASTTVLAGTSNRIAGMKIDQGRREQQHHHRAYQHRAGHGGGDGAAHQPHPPVHRVDLAHQPVMLDPDAFQQARLDYPAAIDDPRQPPGQCVEKRANARQQEHRRHCLADDPRHRRSVVGCDRQGHALAAPADRHRSEQNFT